MPKSLHSALAVALTGAFLAASACSEDDARPPYTADVERNPLYPSAVDRPASEGGDDGQGQAGAAQSMGAGGSSFLPATGGAAGALGAGGGGLGAGGSGLGVGGTGSDAAGGSAGADLGAGGTAASDAAGDAG